MYRLQRHVSEPSDGAYMGASSDCDEDAAASVIREATTTMVRKEMECRVLIGFINVILLALFLCSKTE